MTSPSPRIALYPGTFDPITLGHVDIIRRAASLFDTLIIAIAGDSTGKNPSFSLTERTKMVEQEIALHNIKGNVIALPFEGLLVDFAHRNDASVIVRGLRAVSDFEYEFQMSCINSKLSPSLETIFLPATESTHFIASRLVKEIARLGGNVKDLVSPHVAEKLKDHFG